VKNYSTLREANAELDLEHYNRVAVFMANARNTLAVTVVTVPLAAALAPAEVGAGIGVAGRGGTIATTEVAGGEGAAVAAEERFFIENGVRRSLVVREAGGSEIPATIFRPGQAPTTTTVRLDQLFSPKTSVPLDARFLRIQPPIHTPIQLQPLGLPGQVPTVPLGQVILVP
jgi:hypothetical protein